MALPTFRSLAARRQNRIQEQQNEVVNGGTATAGDVTSERTLTPTYTPGVNVKLATKTRRNWLIASCFFFLISVVFLILVRTLQPTTLLFSSLTITTDNNWKHQRQTRHPLNLLLQTQPRKYHPLLLARRPNLYQLARSLPRSTRFLPSRSLEFLRGIQQRRHNLLLQPTNAILVQSRGNASQ